MPRQEITPPQCAFFDADDTLFPSEPTAMGVAVARLLRTFDEASVLARFGDEWRAWADQRAGAGRHSADRTLSAYLVARWTGSRYDAMFAECNEARRASGQRPFSSEVAARSADDNAAETLQALANVGEIRGVGAAIRNVQRLGMRTVVVTTSAKDRVLACMDSPRANLPRSFRPSTSSTTVYSASSLGLEPKPSPEVYLHAAAAEGVLPQDVVAIEDSPTGMRSAAAAKIGWKIGFLGALEHPADRDDRREALLAAGADVIAEDGRQLRTALTLLARGLAPTPERVRGLDAPSVAA